MKTKQLLIAAACALAINASHAQIPVTDGASIAQNAMNFLQEMAKWKQQIDHMKQQLNTMKQQYQAISGSRGMGNIFDNPELRSYLPPDWQKIYDNVRQGGYAGLTGSARAIQDANAIFNACAQMQQQDRLVCEANASKGATDQGMAIDALDKAMKRMDQIQRLMGQINATTDQKAIAELQARIASEQTAINNEMVKIQLLQMVSAAQDRIQQRRGQEILMRDASRTGSPKFKPVDF